ncbi:MAG: alpha/beta hydrolase [Polyangia bacterium]
MDTGRLLEKRRGAGAWIALAICALIAVGASWIASAVQEGWGSIEVSDVHYGNLHGDRIRAKLFRPREASAAVPVPGAVFAHGYQSNRETGDPIGIELARRGVAVLAPDELGRGNSDPPRRDPSAADFDPSFGVRASLAELRQLRFVDSERTALIGHSLGGGTAYRIALEDPGLRAVAIIGAAYDERATPTRPRNMLMVIGQLDEFRDRMTGVGDIRAEWLRTAAGRAPFGVADPRPARTYGDFDSGTARRVAVPRAFHVGEPHDREVVAEVVDWMLSALRPSPEWLLPPGDQLWPIKEWATLVAMLACLAGILPLALILLRTRAFAALRGPAGGVPTEPPRRLWRHAGINALLMWLYLPSALLLFGLHKYVAPVDGVFPLMVVNGIAGWFLLSNLVGFLLLGRWARRRAEAGGPSPTELGLTPGGWRRAALALLLAALLFGWACGLEHVLERSLGTDFRFVFAFASDLTPRRWALFALYLPLFTAGFLQLGMLLHGQLRRPRRRGWQRTFVHWSALGLAALLAPLLLHLGVQYLPLMICGAIPLVGPGGMLVLFMINLVHIAGVLAMLVPLSTWLFQLTGRTLSGSLLCGMLVSWMLVSSQVIAPVPV